MENFQQQIIDYLKETIAQLKISNILDKHEAAELLRIHPDLLKTYRKEWSEGIHYSRMPSGDYRYNRTLLEDWVWNRNYPSRHQQAIEVWNSKQLCNQPTPKQRKKQR